MEREPIGQEPHLRWDRVVTLPLHATQQTEPKLGPGTGHDGTAIVLDEFANTASAGSLIAFARHHADLAIDDHGVICSFGAGYSIGSLVVRRIA